MNTASNAHPGLLHQEMPAAARRAQRAALARRFLQGAPAAATALDWAALTQAPPWLSLSEPTLGLLARRVGSVLAAPALRLWIAAPRVAAACAALGEDWWHALQAHPHWPALPEGAVTWPLDARTDPGGVASTLQQAGAAVLLSTLPHGATRHAASQLLVPVAALVMPIDQAQALLSTALALQASIAPTP
jgi:hypothetical protein